MALFHTPMLTVRTNQIITFLMPYTPSRFKSNTRQVSIERGRGQTYVSLHGKIKYYYTHDCTYKLYNMWLHIQTYVIAHTNLCDCTQKSRVIARIWNFRRDDDLSWENNHVLDLPSHILAMWRTLNDIKNYIYRFPTYFKTFVDVVSEHM